MAVEDIFVMSALHSAVFIAVFAFLYSRAEDWLWKRVWLIGIFIMMYYMASIERFGFQHIVVANELADLSFGVMIIVMWAIIAAIVALFGSILYSLLKWIQDAGSGKRVYREDHYEPQE